MLRLQCNIDTTSDQVVGLISTEINNNLINSVLRQNSTALQYSIPNKLANK